MRIVYIISKIDKSAEFENTALGLIASGYDLTVINLFPNPPSQFHQFLTQHKIACYEIKYVSKLNYFIAVFKVSKLLKRLRPDIVHCHLFEATLIGLRAAKMAGIEKRIYTRHHSTFHHYYAKHAVKYDKWANETASKIVAVSPKVKEILVSEEGVPENKVVVINHGIRLEDFDNVDEEGIEALKKKYFLKSNSPIIGVVARYDEWKGVQFTIEAFKNILQDYPNAKLLLTNAGKGDYVHQIRNLLGELPVSSYVEISFENNMPALYKCMNLLIHVPVDDHSEAFGLVYIEGMASGVPIIATKSGIGCDILEHHKNSIVVGCKSQTEIVDAVKYLLNDPIKTKEIAANAFELVKNNFSFDKKLLALINLYKSL